MSMEVAVKANGPAIHISVGCQKGSVSREVAKALADAITAQLAAPAKPRFIWVKSTGTGEPTAPAGSGEWYGPYSSLVPDQTGVRQVKTVNKAGFDGGLVGPITAIHIGTDHPA